MVFSCRIASVVVLSGEDAKRSRRLTMAVVAAPKSAMRESTETWPTNVAIASNTSTAYTYRCCNAMRVRFSEHNVSLC